MKAKKSNSLTSDMLKLIEIRHEHNYCRLSKCEKIIEIKYLLENELKKFIEQSSINKTSTSKDETSAPTTVTPSHISRTQFRDRHSYFDSDTSLIDMDISPQRSNEINDRKLFSHSTYRRCLVKTKKQGILLFSKPKKQFNIKKKRQTKSKNILFVNNIPKTYTINDIRQKFSLFGDIISLNLNENFSKYVTKIHKNLISME